MTDRVLKLFHIAFGGIDSVLLGGLCARVIIADKRNYEEDNHRNDSF